MNLSEIRALTHQRSRSISQRYATPIPVLVTTDACVQARRLCGREAASDVSHAESLQRMMAQTTQMRRGVSIFYSTQFLTCNERLQRRIVDHELGHAFSGMLRNPEVHFCFSNLLANVTELEHLRETDAELFALTMEGSTYLGHPEAQAATTNLFAMLPDPQRRWTFLHSLRTQTLPIFPAAAFQRRFEIFGNWVRESAAEK